MDSQSKPAPPATVNLDASLAIAKENWQARYDEGKTGWDRGEPNPMLARWIDQGELRPCKILVPGCGRGYEVVALAEIGFDVTAVDFADTAVQTLAAELQKRGLQASVIQSDLFSFTPANAFDAIYEQTCLCAIHPSLWHAYQASLARWLRPGGTLFALFMQTESPDGPPFGCDIEKMKNLFPLHHWAWSSEPERVDHPMGLHELACVLNRRSSV